ncbi:MAG: DUF4352 domain-containing protein [Oscillospiraceae bacterium]|nr:DUF4352 domain-containing protein [Oscillospiraceae bacterium]
MICPSCKKEISDSLKFCPECGYSLAAAQPPQNDVQSKSEKKKKIYKRWWFWVLIVILLFIIISAISSEKNNNKTNNDSPAVTQNEQAVVTTTKKNENERLKVGDSFTDGYLEISIKSAEVWTGYSEFSKPDSGYKYIRLFAEAKNTGTSDAFVYSDDFKCYADNKPASDPYCGDERFNGDDLSAGRETDGYLYYQIPADAQKIEIEYELNFITSKKVYYDIELS